MTVQTVNVKPVVAQSVGMVGNVVTYRQQQYVVHSVEGTDWYAFQEKDGTITVDTNMTTADWIADHNPIATIIPSGHLVGEGFAQEAYLSEVRRGVCLSKRYV